MQIKIGTNTQPQELTRLTHTEAVKMTTRAGISGAAQTSILADLQAKWGRKVVEPGLQLAMPIHNHQFASFFTVEKKRFLTRDNKLEEKYLFYCHDIVNFLKKVADLRSETWEDLLMLLQGDTGQHYTKISINMVN